MAKIVICKECGEEREQKAHGLCAACYELKWRKDNQERVRECERNRKKRTKIHHREYHLKSNFGITLDEYDEMLEDQSNSCWICGRTPEENGQRLAVDHNHTTGEIRGLLCRKCNRGIGLFQDNPLFLTRAAEYLLREI